jgi:hypothetical protein
VETLLRKQNLLPGKQNVSYQLQKHLMFPYVSHQCFLVFAYSWKHGETLVGNNVSATMFPSLPWALEKNFQSKNWM